MLEGYLGDGVSRRSEKLSEENDVEAETHRKSLSSSGGEEEDCFRLKEEYRQAPESGSTSWHV